MHKNKVLWCYPLVLIVLSLISGCEKSLPSDEEITSASDTQTTTKIEEENQELFEVSYTLNDTVIIEKYIGNDKEVIIPDTINGKLVIDISSKTFEGRKEIEKVLFPNNIKEIRANTFQDCSSLKEVVLNGIESIGKEAFKNCKSLKTIDLSNVTYIGIEAFADCVSLSDDITFNKLEVASLSSGAFRGCTGLNGKTVTFVVPQQQDNMYYGVFSGIDVNIIAEGIDTAHTYLMRIVWDDKCVAAESWLEWSETNNFYEIVNTSVKTSSEALCEDVYSVFNDRVLKSGDSIKVSELKPILENFSDDGKTTYTHPLRDKEATKYRFVDGLQIILNNATWDEEWSEEAGGYISDTKNVGIAKKITSDEVGNLMYSYEKLKDSYEITNNRGVDITFYVVIDNKYGESIFTIYIDEQS